MKGVILFILVDTREDRIIGHAEILVKEDGLCKIDKLFVGDKSIRGQGIGQSAINCLLRYAFGKLNAKVVELNVFDWNVAGIRCYEKCGFITNEGKTQIFRIENGT
jgi:RimJ/RimL family protein N-acetyltransferase